MKKTNIVITLLIVILIVFLIIIGYFFIKNNHSKKNNTNNTASIINNQETNTKNTNQKSDKKIAVVYFSATGNTEKIAKYIQNETNSDIFEINPKQKYKSEDLNYGNSNSRATKEQNDKNARPELETKIDVSNYNIIFLGYPIWWGDVPKIVLSFIDNSNLNGKTVIPFCTSGSSSISKSENTLRQYNSNINWHTGNRFSSTSKKEDIKKWINSLNIQELYNNQVNDIGDQNSMNEFIIEVNNRELIVKAENNSSSNALLKILKEGNITVYAKDYNNFEKVGSLGFDLPLNDQQITTKPGDVILYQGNNICLYYDTNSWNFTKLGEVTNVDSNELKKILGDDNVSMILKAR